MDKKSIKFVLLLIVFCLPALSVSFIAAWAWLGIPLLLQVMIDKVFSQNSPDTLGILGLALLVVTLLASGLEICLSQTIAVLVRSRKASSESFLRLVVVLPRALSAASIITVYSRHIALTTAVLTAVACGSCFFLNRINVVSKFRSYPLPLNFRLPLTLIVLVVLWQAASLVLSGQLTLGQWMALGIFCLQFAFDLLSFTTLVLENWKEQFVCDA